VDCARRALKHAPAPAKKGGGPRRSHTRDTPGWTIPPLWRRPQASRSPPVDFSSQFPPVGPGWRLGAYPPVLLGRLTATRGKGPHGYHRQLPPTGPEGSPPSLLTRMRIYLSKKEVVVLSIASNVLPGWDLRCPIFKTVTRVQSSFAQSSAKGQFLSAASPINIARFWILCSGPQSRRISQKLRKIVVIFHDAGDTSDPIKKSAIGVWDRSGELNRDRLVT